MKQTTIIILAVVVFLAAMGFTAYPIISSNVNAKYASEIQTSYEAVIAEADNSDLLAEKEKAIAYSIQMVDAKTIDEINILQATFLAMRTAVEGLSVKPDIALIDGNGKPGLSIEERTVIKGDAKSVSIAAASILAKVTRDRYCIEMDKKYPEYAFAQHKGYGTKLHYEKIAEHGICDEHRRTFLKKILGE